MNIFILTLIVFIVTAVMFTAQAVISGAWQKEHGGLEVTEATSPPRSVSLLQIGSSVGLIVTGLLLIISVVTLIF